MKTKKSKLIILFLLIALLFFVLYKNERNKIYKKIENNIQALSDDYRVYCDEEILVDIERLNDNCFKTNKELKVINNDIEILNRYEGHIKHTNNISTIYIMTEDNVGVSLTKDNDYVNAKIVFVSPDDIIVNDDLAKIKVRGNSTSSGEKKPYNIKFSEKYDLFGLGESAKKYCLLADCYDPTLMRNYIFFYLAKKMNMEYTSEVSYIDVYLDGEYRGLYILTEPVEIDENRVNINEENGDFLFELEQVRIEEDATYVYTPSGIRFVMCDPENPTNEQLNYIVSKIKNLDDALLSNNDELIEKTIDIDSFAKLYVLNEYAKSVDFDNSSVKFYYKDGKFHAGPVWDFDLSSGNASKTYYTNYYSKDGICYENMGCLWHVYIYLYENSLFKNKVKQYFNKYYDMYENVFITNGLIDNLLEEYGENYNSNYSNELGGAGWVVNKQYSNLEAKRENNYIENVNYLKKWLMNRLSYLKQNNWWDK